MAIEFTTPCLRCGGTGTHEAPPPDYDTEKYTQWLQGWRAKPVVCSQCKGAGEVISDCSALRTKREAAGLSITEFAAQVGITYGYVSNIERGAAKCTPKILELYQRLPVNEAVLLNRHPLRALREAAGLSMTDFARQADAAYSYISNIENDRVKCPPNILSLYLSLSGGKVE